MPPLFRHCLQLWAERRRARRRLANLRAGQRQSRRPLLAIVARGDGAGAAAADATAAAGAGHAGRADFAEPGRRWPASVTWIAAAAVLAALVGALLIAGHARHLGAATASTPQAAGQAQAALALQAALPGAEFTVPDQAGASTSLHPGGALLVLAGMRAAPAVRVDLCAQMRGAADPRLLPLRIGYRFDDVARWAEHNRAAQAAEGSGRQAAAVSLRNVLLVADGGDPAQAMPELQLSGVARADFSDPHSEPLRLSWRSRQGQARWISDATLGQVEQGASGEVALRQQGWLLWGSASALRIERRANVLCPQAGELLVQRYRTGAQDEDEEGRAALVTAFPARGQAVSTYLPSGRYQVPAAPAPALEDQALFAALQQHGLLRLTSAGLIELAPRDLPQWQAAAQEERVADLAGWRKVAIGDDSARLFKRLYYQADGAYVRQQIDIYNSERQLLAWRFKDVAGRQPSWRASAGVDHGAMPVTTSSQMPAAAARLFATLPQGWQPWVRAVRWPSDGAADGQQLPADALKLSLPVAANADKSEIRLMVAGRVGRVSGASAQFSNACTGRACRRPDAVQELVLTPQPGARSVQLELWPLDIDAPEDRQYRHLRLRGDRLVWQALAPPSSTGVARLEGAPALARTVRIEDRNGSTLWNDRAATPVAADAGLAPLLGFGPEHAGSIAGMLTRASATSTPSAAPLNARLTLDLPLQTLGQQLLDCLAMRQGRWHAGACAGGQAPPAARRAGLVLLDAENGDVLVAAGAGAGEVNAANWREVRDFDRSNPARSPLRLPALQHDGGAHQSPGSTFKVISALGLELAAAKDPQLDALLGGMPLEAINRMARQRGFDFDTGAASYPDNPRLAHVTNYREQSLERRAHDGRLGLSQALTYSLNTWFAWSAELSDRSLFGRADGGAPAIQALDADALDAVRPIVAAARQLGFERPWRLDGGLLPATYDWRRWDALQATPSHIDTIHTRHELRQMAIGLRMQATPLQMALASAAIGQGQLVAPRLLLALDGNNSVAAPGQPLGARLERIRAGMKGVVDVGTGAGAFKSPALATVRAGLYGKTGTAPTGENSATVWFTGWLEPGSLPGQQRRLAMAVFVSHSAATGGEHAAPVVAALLAALAQPVEKTAPGGRQMAK